MKKVSIIIPCHNLTNDEGKNPPRNRYFDECMDSVLQQTIGLENLEIILVDDASNDEGMTLRILEVYEQKYPEMIMLVHLEQNLRQGGARNVGLTYASGEYVAFLDADDWVSLDLYQRVYEMAKQDDLDLVYFYHQAVKGDLKVPLDDMTMPTAVYVVESKEQRKQFVMEQIVDLRCTTKLYRRDWLMKTQVAFPEGKIYEEPLFTYPLLYYGERYGVLAEPLYNYRMNENSTMNTSHTFGKLQNHPEVQLQLFLEMIERGLTEDYYDEISYHFLHSYFLETLLFAGNQGITIPLDYFKKMQQMVAELLPNWEENAYIQSMPDGVLTNILKHGLKQKYTEQTLAQFIVWIGQIWN